MRIKSPFQKGSILIAVLWCVALLSVLVIGMLYTTRIDLSIAKSYNDRIQARYLALAGIEKAKALLYQDAKTRQGDGKNHTGELYDSAENFKDCTLGRGSYRVIRRGVDENSTSKIIYGISDEESRLNVNTATADELTKITGLKTQVAASILEWRKNSGVTANNSDNSENQGNEPPPGPPPANGNPPPGSQPGNNNSDSTNSVSGGAGVDYYASMDPPRQPRYGPFQTTRELLMVRGVSRRLFFGDDFKQNELLDFASDEEATNSSPSDVAEGAIADQQPVQNVQSTDTENAGNQTTTRTSKKSSKLSRSNRSSSSSTSSSRDDDNPTDAGWNTLITVDSQESNLSASGNARVNIQTASEADLAVVQGFNAEIAHAIVEYRGKKKFQSIADLLDVTPSQNQGEFGKTITEPVNTGEPVISQDLLQQVADDLTVNSENRFQGLININTAKAEVLNCLTGLTPELTQAIISYRQSTGYFQNIASLLQVPGITREIFQQVAPRITTRSETFRIIAEGKVRSSGVRQRIQAIVLVTQDDVKTLSYREDL